MPRKSTLRSHAVARLLGESIDATASVVNSAIHRSAEFEVVVQADLVRLDARVDRLDEAMDSLSEAVLDLRVSLDGLAAGVYALVACLTDRGLLRPGDGFACSPAS